MSKSVELKTILDIEDELVRLESTASGMSDLLKLVAMAEDDEGNYAENYSEGLYLLVDVQEHAVKSLRKVLETLEKEISAKKKTEEVSAI